MSKTHKQNLIKLSRIAMNSLSLVELVILLFAYCVFIYSFVFCCSFSSFEWCISSRSVCVCDFVVPAASQLSITPNSFFVYELLMIWRRFARLRSFVIGYCLPPAYRIRFVFYSYYKQLPHRLNQFYALYAENTFHASYFFSSRCCWYCVRGPTETSETNQIIQSQ